MTSTSSSQIPSNPKHSSSAPKNQSNDMHTLKSHFISDLEFLQHEISTQSTTKLINNKQQVLFAINDLNISLKKRLGEALFSIFNSFTENIRDSDLESLDISNWVNASLSLFENQLGSLPINQDKVLEVVNEFTHTWTSKIANVSRLSHIQDPSLSGQPMSSFQMAGDQISQNSRRISDIGSSPAKTDREISTSRVSEKIQGSPAAGPDKKGSLFGKVKNLFGKQQPAEGGPTKINLGNEKNFHWDAAKGRYIFDGDEEEEEEKNEGPPPSMSSQQRAQKPAESEKGKEGDGHSLVKPPENRSLTRKKASNKSQAETKKPAFMPSKFVPSTVTQEEEKEKQDEIIGTDIAEEIKRRIEVIFEQLLEEEVRYEGIERIRRDIRELDEVSMSNKGEESVREAKLIALENEFESTQASIIKESYMRRLLESELSSLRESYQQSFEKEYELNDNIKELEKSLSTYKELYNAKSQLWNVSTSHQAQQKSVDIFWRNTKEANSDKKKLIEAENQLRRTELQIQEQRSAANVFSIRYNQILEYLNQENSVSAKLRGMLEESFQAQRDQDNMIIGLKKDTLDLAGKYKRVCEENTSIQREKEILKSNLIETERKLDELRRQLNEYNEKLRGHETDKREKGKELDESSRRINELIREKEELERRFESENGYRRQLEERLNEEEKYREQLEARIQDELNEKRQIEEKLAEEEVFRGKTEQENNEFARRVDELVAEKENIERRFEESVENERRQRAHLEDLERQLRDLSQEKNNLLQEQDNREREIRKEREKMLEELMENKSQNQSTAQEKELLNKFSEEIRGKNLSLEKQIQTLNNEINKLKSEKQRSIETILNFIREIRGTTTDIQGFESLENYMTDLLRGTEEASERHFRALGVLPKVRESLMRELEVERTRKSLQEDELIIRLRNLDKERELFEEQKRQNVEEIQRLKGFIDVVKQQNEQAEHKINELTQEAENLKRENEQHEQRNIQLERSLHEKEIQLGESIKNFGEYQNYQASSLEGLERQFQQFNELKQEMERIKQQLEDEKGISSEAFSIRAELEEQIAKLKEENQEAQQQLDEGFEQYTFLQGKTKEVLEQLKQAKEENSRVTQENAQIIQDNEALQQEITQMKSTIGNLENSRNTQNTQEYSQLAQDNEALHQEIANMKAFIESLEHRNSEVANTVNEHLQRENSTLIEKIQSLEFEVQTRSQIIQELKENFSTQQLTSENNENNTQLQEKFQALSREIQEKEAHLQELITFREEALVNIRGLEEEKEQVLANLHTVQSEKEEALAGFKELQLEQEKILSRLELLQKENEDLGNRLNEEETKTFSMNNILEEAKGSQTQVEAGFKEFESRIRTLEEEKANLHEQRENLLRERDGLFEEREIILKERDDILQERNTILDERNNILDERNNILEERDFILREQEELRRRIEQLEGELAEGFREKTNFPEGEELWEEIEQEFGGSRVMDYLGSMKSKLEIQRGLSAGKLVSSMLKEFEESIDELSRKLEEKDTTILGLTRSLEEMNEQNQKLQNSMTVLEGEHSEKEDYSSIRELYEKKTKRVEELMKELVTKNTQIEEMKKIVDSYTSENTEKEHEVKDKEQKAGGDLKDENLMLRQEIAKEKERCLKVTKEFENYKEKHKNNSEERGAIQHSYSQIIKNLSIQLDELKKKKGIPTAVTVSKSIQTGDDESPTKKTSFEEDNQGKKSGFLSGMAKFFLTEGELKKI